MPDTLAIGADRGRSMIGVGIGLGVSGFCLQYAGFSPAKVGGLQAWFDASDSSTLYQSNGGAAAASAGDPVGYWLDKSGNSRHPTQASGTNKPALRLAVQNGLNVIQFDGVNDSMQLASGITATDFSLIFVGRFVADGGSGANIVFGCGDVHSQNANYINFGDGAENGADNSFGCYGPTSPSPSSMAMGAHINGNYRLYEVTKSGSTFSLTVDGSAVGSATGTSNGLTGSSFIGKYGATTGGYFKGFIGEMSVFSSVVAGSSLTNLRAYFKNKWGTA